MAKENGKQTNFDSGQQYLGTVYAKALLGASQTAANTEIVLAELDSLIDDVFERLPKFEASLASPRVSHEEKVRMLDAAFAGKMSPQMLNFLKVVSEHGRLDCLRAMQRAARQQYNAEQGRVEVEIRTAEPLSASLYQQTCDSLRVALKTEIDASQKIDPELIGGMVVRVGDTVYDGSVADRLRRLRVETLENTSQEIRRSLDRFANAGQE